MKKMIRILCAVLIVLMLPLQAKADVIYEPWDSFYEEHRSECEYHSRSYTAAGPNGDVTVYESPESAWEVTKLSNGETLWISYTYKDAGGVTWGCWEDWEQDLLGWVPMDYLNLIYDGISFEEEHGNQFETVACSLDVPELTGQTVYFWEYPGSSAYIDVKLDGEYRPEFQTSYTDANGTQWVRCGYYMGIRGYWVCLDDPTADFDALYPEGIEETQPETIPELAEKVEEIVPGGNPALKWIAIAAVAGVVALTAVLLFFLKK